MSPSKISLFALSACLAVSGCDSKMQKQQAADLEAAAELVEFHEQNKQRIVEQIEAEGSYVPDSTDSLIEFAEKMDTASEKVSPELAAQLQSQAAIIIEFERLMEPYLVANSQFFELGGIDAVTLASIEDVDNRISMIQKLSIMNDQIDIRFPELFMQVAGSDSPEGKQQLAIAKEVRQADREAYPHMIQSLQIVKKYWETSGNADDGLFYFGDDVPKDEILLYNQHLEAIDAIGERQLEIQRKHYIEP